MCYLLYEKHTHVRLENKNIKKKELMKHFVISLVMVAFGALLACTSIVGYAIYSSYEENHSQVEYASETDNKFYQKMIEMERNTSLYFDGFPTSLTSILFKNLEPGEKILNCGDEPLTLVSRDLNRTDINRYPYYVIKDAHGNVWTLFRHNNKFRLTRKDETEYKEWLKEMEERAKIK
jgi:hypothetical protein